MENYISLSFPFKESEIGYIFNYDTDNVSAIKSDVLHILVTRKGSRFFNRNFGTSLHEFLFDPNDSTTSVDIKNEINNCLETLRPDVSVKQLLIEETDISVIIKFMLYDNLINNTFDMNLIIDK